MLCTGSLLLRLATYRDSNIVYYVGTVSLQWPRILKTIKEDAQYFFTEQGGWSSILGEDEDAEDNGRLQPLLSRLHSSASHMLSSGRVGGRGERFRTA